MALWIRNSWNISNISQQKSRVIENKWWQEGNREIGKGNLGLYRLRQKKREKETIRPGDREKKAEKDEKLRKCEGKSKNEQMNHAGYKMKENEIKCIEQIFG